jgi:hypothetical protein
MRHHPSLRAPSFESPDVGNWRGNLRFRYSCISHCKKQAIYELAVEILPALGKRLNLPAGETEDSTVNSDIAKKSL